MPTLSPEPHRNRDAAESFGIDAARYDRTRPTYPTAMIDRIVAAAPGRDVLDVGCGTGISSRQLQAAGCQVLGVDVDERMAEFARQSGVAVEVSSFEDWDPAGRTFDAVVAGQAWHWVDPVGGAAKAAKVLRPGGRLALFWNTFEPPAEVAEAFNAVSSRVTPDLPGLPVNPGPDSYFRLLGTTVDGIGAAGFGEPERWRFPWQHTYSKAEWLDVVPTQGFHTRLPPDTLRTLLDGFGEAIDGFGGSFVMSYTALVVTAALPN
ncbi:MAG TPA: class I SAM-dependent methyltransferase [Pseudonocardiaceae bacterium]|jgi:SAM-dependent methyltransferase|nr:class I SAM-dependent methyltransferase [Pseudonocardiaceae bacterium]